MRSEPSIKRTIAFFDGQNIFHAAREAFGYQSPNYEPQKLTSHICDSYNWKLEKIRFYTGVPKADENKKLHEFWSQKTRFLKQRGVEVFKHPLYYRYKEVECPNCGEKIKKTVAKEKGVDIRIALDIVRLANENKYDVCLIFSQDMDFLEAVKEVKEISHQQERWIKIACAFPDSETLNYRRGIEQTDWIKINKSTYDECLDHRKYN